MTTPILEVDQLATHFPVQTGSFFNRKTELVRAVDGVSLELNEGEILGLVGESGCGKSTLARGILNLVPVTSGLVKLNGTVFNTLSVEEQRKLRPAAQMIFQDPYGSLNPRMTVYSILAEPMLTHGFATKKTVLNEVIMLMEKVGLAARHIKKYPHEFSGGQRQRIAIARALALRPKLILADEPVSALDVSVQAQILNLLAKLCRSENLALLFITHDLSVVRHIADRVAVMYLGRIVEEGPTESVLNSPQHPYTKSLISAVPVPDPEIEKTRKRIILKGDPPSPMNPPTGCAFHPRCSEAQADCVYNMPLLDSQGLDHRTACFYARGPLKSSD